MDDLQLHIQKNSHKEKASQVKSHNQSFSAQNDDAIPAVDSNGHNDKISQGNGNQWKAAQSIAADMVHISEKPNRFVPPVAKQESVASNPTLTRISEPALSQSKPLLRSLEKTVNPEQVLRFIGPQLKNITVRKEERINHETQIMETLTRCLTAFHPTLKVVSIGSSTYGFSGSITNFNILAKAGKLKNSLTYFPSFLIPSAFPLWTSEEKRKSFTSF